MSLNKNLIFHAPLASKNEKVGSELITNGDMEIDADWADYAAVTTNEQSSTYAYQGTYSRRIYTSTAVTGGIRGDNFATVTGRTHELNFWVYSPDNSSCRVAIRQGSGATWAEDTGTLSFTQGTWNHKTVRYTESAGGSGAYIVIHTNNQAGNWYIDNVSIKEVKTADITPQQNHGVVHGATQNENDMSFDGTDDYISIADNDIFSFGNGTTDKPFSVATWVKPTVNDSGLMSKDDGGSNREWSMFIRSSTTDATFYLYDQSAGAYIGRRGGTPTLNEWNLIVGTYDGSGNNSGLKVYLNGVRTDTDNYSGGTYVAMEALASIVTIGHRTNSLAGSAKGSRIYNKELTSQENEDLYKLGGAQRTINTGTTKKDLVLDMPLREVDEKVGSEEIDDSSAEVAIQKLVDSTITSNTTIALSSEQAHTGTNSTKIISTSSAAATHRAISFRDNSNTKIEAGKTYKISGWFYYPTGQTGSSIILYKFNNAGTWASAVSQSNSWQYREGYADGVSVISAMYMSMYTSADVGTYWYLDDFSIKEAETADQTPNSRLGTLMGATQNTDSISVDEDSFIDLSNTFTMTRAGSCLTFDVKLNAWIAGNYGDFHSILGNNNQYQKFVAVNKLTDTYGRLIVEGTTNNDFWTTATQNVTMNLGTWYHICINADDGTVETFRNNISYGTSTPISDISIDEIGNENVNVRGDFEIKNLKFHNSPLIASDREKIYKRGI